MELNSKNPPLIEIPEIGLTIHDLVGGNSFLIDEYLSIYQELLPQYSRYAPIMRSRAQKPLDPLAIEKWHQGLICIEGHPVGMIGIIYNRNRNTGMLMDFALRPEVRDIHYGRNTRLAGLILQLAFEQLTKDARESGHQFPLCMIAEVEHTALIRKYADYGYREFPIEYFEPPFTPELLETSKNIQNLDKIDYKKIHLGAFMIPGSPFDPRDPSLIRTVLHTLLTDHYQLPAENWLMRKTFQEIPA